MARIIGGNYVFSTDGEYSFTAYWYLAFYDRQEYEQKLIELSKIMPHIVIKTISGPSKKQLQEAAEQISSIVNKTMGKPQKYISVSVEEYSMGEWEGVYNEYVKDKDNVLVKPGYSDPKTFN